MTDRIIVACTIALALVYLYATSQIPTLEIGDPLGPKAFPVLIGIGMLVAAGLLAVEIWKDRAQAAPTPAPAAEPRDYRFYWVLAGVTGWSVLYYALLERVGYIVDTAVYLYALMCWFYRGRWVLNAAVAVLYSVLSYILFRNLDVHLPGGILPF